MCLWKHEGDAATKRRAAKIEREGTTVCYKTYEVRRGRLFPLYYNRFAAIKGGWVKSNRKKLSLTGSEERTQRVNHGIHVWLRRRDARHACYSSDRRFVKVTARSEDLVGVGTHCSKPSAVFMKVWLSKAEKDKVLKGTSL